MSWSGIAIALGMAVDADVVALEACPAARALGHGSRRAAHAAPRRGGIFCSGDPDGAADHGAQLPAVLRSRGEPRPARPLAITKTLVIVAARLYAHAGARAADRLLRGRVIPEFDNPITRGLVRIYRPFVHFALSAV